MVVAYFYPMGMTYPILPEPFFLSDIKMVKTHQTISSSKSFEQDERALFIAVEPLHHEESHLIYGPLSLLFQTKGSQLNINQMYLFRHLQEHFYVTSNFCYVYSDA